MTEAAEFRVVVLQEHDSHGTARWVGQALDIDVATQGDSVFDVVTELGFMFDTRDALAEEYENLVVPAPAPDEYHALWERGRELGRTRLGQRRWAQVRLCSWELET